MTVFQFAWVFEGALAFGDGLQQFAARPERQAQILQIGFRQQDQRIQVDFLADQQIGEIVQSVSRQEEMQRGGIFAIRVVTFI